jgi:hypothetical protein
LYTAAGRRKEGSDIVNHTVRSLNRVLEEFVPSTAPGDYVSLVFKNVNGQVMGGRGGNVVF